MKAMLLIDMPNICDECPFSWKTDKEWLLSCQLEHDLGTSKGQKPTWCPLKPMPEKIDIYEQQKKDFNSYPDEFLADKLLERHGYERTGCCADVYCGWNVCIEELEK